MYKSVMRLLAFPIFIGAFCSCQSNKTETRPNAATASIIKAMDTLAVAVDKEPLVDSNFKNFPVDFSNDGVHYPASLLTTGNFGHACKCWLLTVDPNEISL